VFPGGKKVLAMKITVLAVFSSALLSIAFVPEVVAQADAAVGPSEVRDTLAPTAQSTPDKSSAEPAAIPSRDTELTIASGDLLGISLFDTAFSCAAEKPGCEARVSDSGSIVLPLVGSIRVAGLTVAQAEQVIAARFSEGGFFNNPQVTVVQKEYATQGISVLGEVQKPGIYPLLGSHSLLHAISAAGGTTVKAGNDVTLIHPGHGSKSEHVDLRVPSSSGIRLTPGDTIVVSKAGIVYVVGDVRQPTGVTMESTGLTVLKAIAMAQGTNSTASLNNVKLIRNTPEGKREIPISLSKILSNRAADLELQPEDILFVPSSAAKSATRRGLEAILQTATGVAVYRRY
jgi:polysaccharide biosynthesis/export protein